MANTAMFESYEQEYCSLSQSIGRKVTQIPDLNGEEKKAAIRDTQKELEEADASIQQMDTEVRMLPVSERNKVMGRLRNYKGDFQKLKQDLRKSEAAFPTQSTAAMRNDLFAGANSDLQVTSLDQRARLLQSTERLEKSSARIKESHQTILRTEELGTNILGDLHTQRDTIIHSRDTLHQADENVSKSRRILNAMGRRVMTNKMILAFVILILLGLITIVVYFKWFAPDNPSS